MRQKEKREKEKRGREVLHSRFGFSDFLKCHVMKFLSESAMMLISFFFLDEWPNLNFQYLYSNVICVQTLRLNYVKVL